MTETLALIPDGTVEIDFADVKVGDIVVFGWARPGGFYVADRDPVVKIDARGIHFEGGTYLAEADRGNGKVLIEKRKPKTLGWWNAGDAVVQWALNDPAVF